MRTTITTIATVAIFGTALFITERNRRAEVALDATSTSATSTVNPVARIANRDAVRAPGRIEGRNEAIEVRARIAEQIEKIHVQKGQWVSEGDVLVTLDASKLSSERDLAAAGLTAAEAQKQRLENGNRESEIDSARQEYSAAMARLDGAEKSYARAVRLLRDNAVSQQRVDDLYAQLNAQRGQAMAAKARMETLDAPPREDDLLAATAAVNAARARLQLAQIQLNRSEIRAPSDGQILAVEAKAGELTGPEHPEPLIIMADTSRLRAVAEVDEYDALKVKVGQRCEVTSDGTEGVLARGTIAEVEPQMHPKTTFGQWAGERSDTFSRRVWIELNEAVELPVGLPVDVYIKVSGDD